MALSGLETTLTYERTSILSLTREHLSSDIRKTWNDLTQQVASGKSEVDYRLLRKINRLIFDYISSKHPTIPTPRAFSWPFGALRMNLPIPIQNEQIVSSEPGDLFTVQGEQFLFDAESPQVFYLNGKPTLLKRGDVLSEGTMVCYKRSDEEELTYVLTVGKKGNVYNIIDDQKKVYPETSPDAKLQSFEILTKQCYLKSKSVSETFEVEFSEPFLNGFIFSSLMIGCSTPSEIENAITWKRENDEQVVIDHEKDIILKALVDYLKVEFEEMNYTKEQKIFRLWQVVSCIMVPIHPKSDVSFDDSNYYLGEFLRYGRGRCRHFALLLKTLADAFELSNSLILQYKQPEGHASNLTNIHGNLYKIDAFFRKFVPVNKNSENRSQVVYHV